MLWLRLKVLKVARTYHHACWSFLNRVFYQERFNQFLWSLASSMVSFPLLSLFFVLFNEPVIQKDVFSFCRKTTIRIELLKYDGSALSWNSPTCWYARWITSGYIFFKSEKFIIQVLLLSLTDSINKYNKDFFFSFFLSSFVNNLDHVLEFSS